MLIVAALCASIAVLITHPGMLKYPFGWWTLALIVGVAAFPIGTFFLYSTTVEKNNRSLLAVTQGGNKNGHILIYVSDLVIEDTVVIVIIFVLPLIFAIAPIPLARDDLSAYLVIAIVPHFILWLTALRLFSSDKRYYPYRPNEYVDIYEDERSRLWLARPLSLTSGRLCKVFILSG